jgi:hypothetical protein
MGGVRRLVAILVWWFALEVDPAEGRNINSEVSRIPYWHVELESDT